MTPPKLVFIETLARIFEKVPVSELRVPSVVSDVLKYNPWISSFMSIILSELSEVVPSSEYGIS